MIRELKKLRNATAVKAERIVGKLEGLKRYAIEKRDAHNNEPNINTFSIEVFLSPTLNSGDITIIGVDLDDFISIEENIMQADSFIERLKDYVPRAASATVPA